MGATTTSCPWYITHAAFGRAWRITSLSPGARQLAPCYNPNALRVLDHAPSAPPRLAAPSRGTAYPLVHSTSYQSNETKQTHQ